MGVLKVQLMLMLQHFNAPVCTQTCTDRHSNCRGHTYFIFFLHQVHVTPVRAIIDDIMIPCVCVWGGLCQTVIMIIISCLFFSFSSSSSSSSFHPAVTLRLLCVLHGTEERERERDERKKREEKVAANALKGLVSCLPELIEIV